MLTIELEDIEMMDEAMVDIARMSRERSADSHFVMVMDAIRSEYKRARAECLARHSEKAA